MSAVAELDGATERFLIDGTAAAADPSEDPDVRVALRDHRDTVLQIRVHSARALSLVEGSRERAAEQAAIEDLVADMQTRCDRIDLSLDALFRMINADLRENPPAQDHRPTGRHLRVLEAEAIRAAAEEERAHEALEAAHVRLQRATHARIAARRACAGYVADLAA